MTTTRTSRTSRMARRFAGLAIATSAVLGVVASPAQAVQYNATVDCGSRTLEAPLISDPGQLNAFYWRVNGGQWNVQYIFTNHIDNWKWTASGWSYAGASGGFYLLPDYGRVEAWTYRWNVVNGQFSAVGWTNLGTC